MNFHIPLALFLASLLILLIPQALWAILILSFSWLLYLFLKRDEKEFTPQSEDFKSLEKIKKQRAITEEKKHSYISDQLSYIANHWGYTKAQERAVENFLNDRAYLINYNSFSASILPQMIEIIDGCHAQAQKGCKQKVAQRLRELTELMNKEIKRKKLNTIEDFEINIEVYDALLKEKR